MYTLVIYDISDDEIRFKVANACKSVGLSRIQKSAFLGVIDSQTRKSLRRRLERILGDSSGNIQIFLICENDMRFRDIIGKIYKEGDEDIMVI